MMFTVILLYSSLGQILFGGVVYEQKADELNEIMPGFIPNQSFMNHNFNDYYNSIMTLIIVLFVGF